MALIHDSIEFTNQDIYSGEVALVAIAAARDLRFGFVAFLSSLNSAASTITLRLQVGDGNGEYRNETFTFAKGVGVTRLRMQPDPDTPYFLAADAYAVLSVQSTASADIHVQGRFFMYDPQHATLDVDLVDGETLPETIKYMAAVLCGEASGAGSGAEVFKSLPGSSDRVTVTVDADGDRTDVSLS